MAYFGLVLSQQGGVAVCEGGEGEGEEGKKRQQLEEVGAKVVVVVGNHSGEGGEGVRDVQNLE